jgi:hypothetical protein
MRSLVMLTSIGTLAIAAFLLSPNARADMGVCGALASGSCSFVVGGGCTAQCEPLNMTATCGVTCSGQCTATASTECSSTCDTSCLQSCTPGATHCKEHCEGDCHSHCESDCTDSNCQGECDGACTGHCSEKCVQDPPDCQTLCQTSCDGSCEVQANLSCYLDCEASCTVDMTGGCQTDCQEPYGALFCDGQYVEITNYSDCAASFGFSAQASASVGCSMAPRSSTPFGLGALAAVATGIGMTVVRRRRAGK